jgi:hypothetical protein
VERAEPDDVLPKLLRPPVNRDKAAPKGDEGQDTPKS